MSWLRARKSQCLQFGFALPFITVAFRGRLCYLNRWSHLPLNVNLGYQLPAIPWTEFPAECLWYFVPMAVFHAVVFLVGCLILIVVTRNRSIILKRIQKLALFILLLLIVGSLFNGVWSCSVYNRFYHSTDYIFDFIPFWPISWITVDTPWGDGHGELYGTTTLFQLKLLWLLFAIGTWGTTILLYRTFRRWSRGEKSPQMNMLLPSI
jgi:hypothetical protein